jgi:hypothetical protein
VGGMGRLTDRMRRKAEIDTLERMAAELELVINERRHELDEDPLAVSPLFLKELIDLVIPPVPGEELPIIIQLNGLRMNLTGDDIAQIREITVGTKKLADICEIRPSGVGIPHVDPVMVWFRGTAPARCRLRCPLRSHQRTASSPVRSPGRQCRRHRARSLPLMPR